MEYLYFGDLVTAQVNNKVISSLQKFTGSSPASIILILDRGDFLDLIEFLVKNVFLDGQVKHFVCPSYAASLE